MLALSINEYLIFLKKTASNEPIFDVYIEYISLDETASYLQMISGPL